MNQLILKYTKKNEAEIYCSSDYQRSPIHRNRLAYILEMVGAHRLPNKATRILDVGCGIGNIAAPLANKGYSVLGIDVHAPSIERAAKTHCLPNLSFRTAALQSMDLSKFDVIVLTEVLEHVTDWQGMLDYIAKGMKGDAVLILTVPNGWSPMEIICRPSYLLKKTKAGTRLVYAIKRMLHTKDLTTENEQTPHINFYGLKTLFKVFAAKNLIVEQFSSIFFIWSLWECFFSNLISERWALRDYRLAQHMPCTWRTLWFFALVKQPAHRGQVDRSPIAKGQPPIINQDEE